MKNKKKTPWKVIVAVLLILVGAGIYFYPTAMKMYMGKQIKVAAEKTQTELTREKVEEVEQELQTNPEAANFDFETVTPITPEHIASITESQVAQLSGMGAISVPELGVNLPIYPGVDNVALSVGAGTLSPSQVMGQGNYSLASHYVSGGDGKYLFTPLLQAREGMKIYLTDLGKVYEYEVYQIELVPETGVHVIEESQVDEVGGLPVVTLVTCYETSEAGRQIVQGKLTNVYEVDAAPQHIIDGFNIESMRNLN